MVAITSATICGARPSDGSSISSTRGFAISARPIASICCSPPERCAGDLRSPLGQPREHVEHRVEGPGSACRLPGRARGDGEVLAHRQAAEDAAALRHQRDALRGDPLGRQAGDRRAETSTVPRRGGSRPTATFMQVVLPAPLRPSRPSSRPSPQREATRSAARGCRRRRRRCRRARAPSRQDRPPGCADRATTSARVPSTMTSPKCSSVMRSAKSSATSMSCSIITMVTSRGMRGEQIAARRAARRSRGRRTARRAAAPSGSAPAPWRSRRGGARRRRSAPAAARRCGRGRRASSAARRASIRCVLAVEVDERVPAQRRQAEQRQRDVVQDRVAGEQRDDLIGAGEAEMRAPAAAERG